MHAPVPLSRRPSPRNGLAPLPRRPSAVAPLRHAASAAAAISAATSIVCRTAVSTVSAAADPEVDADAIVAAGSLAAMHTEAIASGKAAEVIYYAREIERAFGKPIERAFGKPIERAFGKPPAGPTLLGTDNKANLRVGSSVGAPTRSKHFLRRYHTLKQGFAAGEVVMRHVSDT